MKGWMGIKAVYIINRNVRHLKRIMGMNYIDQKYIYAVAITTEDRLGPSQNTSSKGTRNGRKGKVIASYWISKNEKRREREVMQIFTPTMSKGAWVQGNEEGPGLNGANSRAETADDDAGGTSSAPC